MIIVLDCPLNETEVVAEYEYMWSTNPPVPFIDQIQKDGLVLIKFSATMVVEAALNKTALEYG